VLLVPGGLSVYNEAGRGLHGMALRSLLLALAFSTSGHAFDSPAGKKVSDARHRREVEERFSAWRKKAKALPKTEVELSMHRPVGKKTEAVRLKPKLTGERPLPSAAKPAKALEQLQTAAFKAAPEAPDADEQWQKDYEAFVSLQRVKSNSAGQAPQEEDPALVSALLVGSTSNSGSLASLLGRDQQQEAAVEKQKLEEAQRREARRKKEQEEKKRVQELKERKIEDISFQAQDRARKYHEQQIHERLEAVPVEGAPQEEVPQNKPTDERYERWKKEPRSPMSVLDLSRLRTFRNQQETVKTITREVESKHRPLFDIVEDLRSQQEEQVDIRRPVEDGRHERWHNHKLRRKAMLLAKSQDTKVATVEEDSELPETSREQQLLQLQKTIEAKDYEEAPRPLGRTQKQRGEKFETWKKLHFHRR